MSKPVCELCGSSEFVKKEGFFICSNCGCKYSLEEARKLINSESDGENAALDIDISSYADTIEQLESAVQNIKESSSDNDSFTEEELETIEQLEESVKGMKNAYEELVDSLDNGCEDEDSLIGQFKHLSIELLRNKDITIESLLDSTSKTIVEFINKIYEADDKKQYAEISTKDFFRAKAVLLKCIEENTNNWNHWFLLGVLDYVQAYTGIDDGSEHGPDPVPKFFEAFSFADDETIRDRLLPFIEGLKEHYKDRYVAELIQGDDDYYPSELVKYLFLYHSNELGTPYKNKTYDEWNDLLAIAKERQKRNGIELFSDDQKKIIDVVKRMNQYKDQLIEIDMSVLNDEKLFHELRKQIDACGFFDKERKMKLMQEQREVNSRICENTYKWGPKSKIHDEAYKLMCEFKKDPPPKELWDSQFGFSIFYYTQDVFKEIEKKQEHDPKLENSLNLQLDGLGFKVSDYYTETDVDELYKLKDIRDNRSYGGGSTKGTKIYNGRRTYDTPAYTVVDGKVYSGTKTYDNPVYTIQGDKVYPGRRTYDEPAYTIKGDKVYPGRRTYDEPAYTIQGDKIYKGTRTYDEPVYTIKL